MQQTALAEASQLSFACWFAPALMEIFGAQRGDPMPVAVNCNALGFPSSTLPCQSGAILTFAQHWIIRIGNRPASRFSQRISPLNQLHERNAPT
jgi:hypothetical protein